VAGDERLRVRDPLWVLASNERARAFYGARGWRPDGGTKTEPREGFSLNEVRYRRRFD
jgi:Tfp pilus assembly protein PilP